MRSGIGLSFGGMLLSVAAVIGCHSDRPHEYGQQRPPVDRLDERDRGLQSKDIVSASDQMAQSLLSLPELNASAHRWTIVTDRVENETGDRRQNLDIFLRRLNTRLAQLGRGRVQLIENRDRYHDLQSRELEQTGHGAAGAAGVQPDFVLYAKASELPNRATSYYYFEFTLTNF